MVLLRKLFILQVVRMVLTYNFSNCNFTSISKIFSQIIFYDLKGDLNGAKFKQIEDCKSKSACLLKIEYYTFNPIPGCPSLPEKTYVRRTRAAFINHCPGYSETEINGTQDMAQEVQSVCRNQTSQILNLWHYFMQSPQ